MDNKTLKEIEAKLNQYANTYKINEAYVDGKNHFILYEQAPKDSPDHRVPVALGKMAVDDMTGYAGRAGDRQTVITRTDNEPVEDDPFIEYTKEMEEYNEEKLETSELFDEACSQGVAYEIFWPSDAVNIPGGILTAEFKMVPASSVWLVWTEAIKPELAEFVYFSGTEKRKTASVYKPLIKEEWVSVDGGEYEFVEETEHPFTEPPINIFQLNRKNIPLFEAGKSLIDAYDIIVSRSMNEVERFNDAILLLAEKASEEFEEGIKRGEVSIIDDQADSAGVSGISRPDLPRYLQKDFSGVSQLYKETLDRLYKDYRKIVKVFDIGNDETAGAVSGASQAYKLLGQEFMAAKIDTYFNRGLAKRLEFYAMVYNAGVPRVDVNDYKATIKAKRNLPVNITEIVAQVVQLRGILSDETILEYLPEQLVPDVARELERLKSQEPKNVLNLPDPMEGDDDSTGDASGE